MVRVIDIYALKKWDGGVGMIILQHENGLLPLLETCNLHEDHHFLLLFILILISK